mmetsp:Transcript_21911/g.32019  ORF Transcript_21911/g.32019 Transcript_21911/m.32019 type:complete len:81 (+) Transcript_21911:1213-1455(+)
MSLASIKHDVFLAMNNAPDRDVQQQNGSYTANYNHGNSMDTVGGEFERPTFLQGVMVHNYFATEVRIGAGKRAQQADCEW